MNWVHPRFTLRQLQYACAVAEELNFGRAAELCSVSQPALSAQLAELESSLGLRLFERGRRGVLVTREGVPLLERMRGLLLAAADLDEAARGAADPLAGRLRLGVIPTMGPYLVPEVDSALRDAFPRLRFEWREEKTEVLVGEVEAGRLDAALLALEADLGRLESAVVGRDPFLLAVPVGHRLAKARRRVSIGELSTEPVLLLDDGHCFRDQALELCSRLGADEADFRATSLPTLVQMVIGEKMVTLIPSTAAEVENRRGELVLRRFRAPEPVRTVAFVYRPQTAIRERLDAVIGLVRKVYRREFSTG